MCKLEEGYNRLLLQFIGYRILLETHYIEGSQNCIFERDSMQSKKKRTIKILVVLFSVGAEGVEPPTLCL